LLRLLSSDGVDEVVGDSGAWRYDDLRARGNDGLVVCYPIPIPIRVREAHRDVKIKVKIQTRNQMWWRKRRVSEWSSKFGGGGRIFARRPCAPVADPS
jgi:hypothetical protein